MKSILFSVPFGMSARNFMRSDVFHVLKEEAKLLVVSSLSDDPAFCQEFSHPNVQFFNIPRVRSLPLRIVENLLFPLETTWLTKTHPEIETFQTLETQLRSENYFRYLWFQFLHLTIGQIPRSRSILRSLYDRFSRNPEAEKLFDQNQIDLLFTTHGYVQEETELALAAKKRNITVVNMIHSWDNVTTKSAMRQITNTSTGRLWRGDLTDWVIVWNEILLNEIHQLYGFPKDRIFVSGIPQFDGYADRSKFRPRSEFFKGIGGDPDKKLILYMAAAPVLFHDQSVILNDLIQAIQEKKFVRPSQLLIRFHPRTDMSSWREKFKAPDVIFCKPSAAYAALPISRGWEPETTESNEIATQIFHSDIVLNGFSTTSLDAAAFDKPIICYGYEGDTANLPMIERYQNGVTHYQKLMEMGGIRVARNGHDLIGHINSYLQNPQLDADGREKIRHQQCFKIDGQSGRRIAEFLFSH